MQININELNKKNRYNSINIIDIRDEISYLKGHIINSKNIPANMLIRNPEKYLNQKEIYYIYCQSGKTSDKVVNILNSQGYHTCNIVGGYNNYLLWK